MMKLLTFDVTGTLLRMQPGVGHQYASVLYKTANISANPETIEKCFLKSYNGHSQAYPIFGKKSGLPIKAWWQSVFLETLLTSEILTSSHCTLSSHSIDKPKPLWILNDSNSLIAKSFDVIFNNFAYKPCPHVFDVFRYLQRYRPHVVVGAITNSDERVSTALYRAELDSHLDFVLTSTKCGCEKPDARIFEEALKIASDKSQNHIELNQAVHVGDNLEEDYCGPINAGFSVAYLIDPENKFFQQINPKHRLNNLSELIDKLKEIK